MAQKHYKQSGTFHITANSKKDVSWCTCPGIPEILIDNLFMTRNIQNAKIYAFCIMPDHMHILMSPGEKGLSAFMHSFKRNSSKDIKYYLGSSGNRTRAAVVNIFRSRGSDTPALQFTGWHNGFYDERIRSADQRTNAFNYIKRNPIKHHSVTDIVDWPWHSMHFEHLLDSTDFWFDSPFDPN